MKGMLFVYGCLVLCSLAALSKPSRGVIGYFGFAVLIPTWVWRWSIPRDPGFQKYLAIATILGLLFTGMRGNRIRGRIAWAIGGLLVFLGLSYLSAFGTIDPAYTAQHMDVMWKIVLMTAIGLLVLDSPRELRIFAWVLVLAQGFNAWEINLQYLQTGHSWAARNGWAMLDNNTYSVLTLPVMGLSAGLALFEPRLWQRGLAAFVFVLQLHEIMLLESRGCMLGGVVLLILGFVYMPKTRGTLATTAVALLVGAVLAGPPVVKEFSTIFQDEGERDSSAESRFSLWKAGIGITQDYPLLGAGPDAARRLVPRYYPGGLDTNNKALHNLFFDVSAGTGIPATLAYFSFFGLTWFTARRRWRAGDVPPWAKPALFAALCGLPAYMLASMFSSGLRIESPYACTVLSAAALLVLRRNEAVAPVRSVAPRYAGYAHPHALQSARIPSR